MTCFETLNHPSFGRTVQKKHTKYTSFGSVALLHYNMEKGIIQFFDHSGMFNRMEGSLRNCLKIYKSIEKV
jgi:hypothetical protein